MASPSSSLLSRNWSYDVFASFHGPDVSETLLSHMRKLFDRSGITMFDDQKIEKSARIPPSLTEGISESRIAIVILSKKYASSSWCLDELVEILECKEAIGQRVMTIFYRVEPSDVRNQTGEFGIAFNEICELKTDEERQKWSKALKYVANIAGEDFLTWGNEASMIKKIARDVSDELHDAESKRRCLINTNGINGLEAHLREMKCLLDFAYDGVKIVAITGPAGIGKTTIARVLESEFSHRFQLTCFVDDLTRVSYRSSIDDYGLKSGLQEHFLSNILNQHGIKISHLGAIKERLHKQRVLIVIDDVNNIMQLEALAGDISWFGPGSRIIVTTENKELLQQHGSNNMYHVGFPSDVEAVKILRNTPHELSDQHSGFKKLAERVTKLCDKLPLSLRVVGSSLGGEEEYKWEDVITKLERNLHGDIKDVLRVGYESLDEHEQTLFLHIAIFFNYRDGYLVENMFANGNLDVKRGLKILDDRSLIKILRYDQNRITMHKLLKQMAVHVIHKQELWKRQILIDAHEICGVLENESGTRAVYGISFDISSIHDVSISKNAFKRMPNLRFLMVYKSREYGNGRMHIPEGMEFPRCLRLLHWEAYPNKCLPPTFQLEYLVSLNLKNSQLEYLWQGTQSLTNLKELDLSCCRHLKELPDFSKVTNLEELDLSGCTSLVEIPTSCWHLQKLKHMRMIHCINLEVIPAHMNLTSLKEVNMMGCSRLRSVPVISTNIKRLYISDTAVEDLPASIRRCSGLESLTLCYNEKLKEITHLPMGIKDLDLSYSAIERIPDCIKDIRQLRTLNLSGCRRLTSLPKLSGTLKSLMAEYCESLETVFCPLSNLFTRLDFINCFRLGEQARQEIIQQQCLDGWAMLPGREVPTEFDHRARGNSLTIPHSAFSGIKVCLVISPNHQINNEYISLRILCRRKGECYLDSFEQMFNICVSNYQAEHLFIFHTGLPNVYPSEVSTGVVLDFNSLSHNFDIIECGAQTFASKKINFRRKHSFTNWRNEFQPAWEDQCSESYHADYSSDEFESSDELQELGDEFESSKAYQDLWYEFISTKAWDNFESSKASHDLGNEFESRNVFQDLGYEFESSKAPQNLGDKSESSEGSQDLCDGRWSKVDGRWTMVDGRW